MNYLDLGYDQNLSQFTGFPDFTSTTNLNGFEGMDASQVLSLGRIQSPDGQWYIDFDKGEISLPDNSVTSKKIKSLEAGKIIAGNITVTVGVGDGSAGSVLIDGENERIIITDDSGTPRILLGYQENGF